MRGAPGAAGSGGVRTGIIPAYAGSTGMRRDGDGQDWDHPRVCGEHSRQKKGHRSWLGSSPRMRGALEFLVQFGPRPRIIPAYAGSTTWSASQGRQSKDHPRVCGEHSPTYRWRDRVLGSSPRMRGAPSCSAGRGPCRRTIPAYAGSTTICAYRQNRNQDHPRVCGEHPEQSVYPVDSGGSSPRMRGAHVISFPETL